MGWERGRYYTRSKKVNGRVVREYVGTGRVAELAARMDTIDRERRRMEALAIRQERTALELDADLEALIEMTNQMAQAALLAAGYYRHKRGEWRKRREQATVQARSER